MPSNINVGVLYIYRHDFTWVYGGAHCRLGLPLKICDVYLSQPSSQTAIAWNQNGLIPCQVLLAAGSMNSRDIGFITISAGVALVVYSLVLYLLYFDIWNCRNQLESSLWYGRRWVRNCSWITWRYLALAFYNFLRICQHDINAVNCDQYFVHGGVPLRAYLF